MASDPGSSNKAGGGSPQGGGRASGTHAWVVGGALETWWSLHGALHGVGIELRPVGAEADLGALALEAERQDGVIILDLAMGAERALATVARCRAGSTMVPLVAVLPAASLDLNQRLRAAGVQATTSQPLDAPKMRAAVDEACRVSAAQRRAPRAKKKILVVDDDRDYRESTMALLESEGYEVLCASSGEEGLNEAMAQKPDLMVLDIMMENLWKGYEVSQAIKHQSGYESVREIPILMVSSIQTHPADRFARSDSPEMALPDSYMVKPVNIPAFLEAVRTLLGQGAGKGPAR